MTDLTPCAYYKHYKENGRHIIERVNLSDMQEVILHLYRQRVVPDLTSLDDQPQPIGLLDE